MGHDDHVVDRLLHLGEQVRGDQDGVAERGLVADEGPQPLDALRVEAVGRLVQDEDLWIPEQGRGQLQPLPHAQRELAHPTPGHVGQADQVEGLVHPGHRETGSEGHRLQVVLGPAGRVEAGGLEHRPDVPDGLVEFHIAPSAEGGGAPADGHQAQQHPECRGLARSVGPEEPGHPAGGHLEGELVHGPEGSELLGQPAHFDGRRHRPDGTPAVAGIGVIPGHTRDGAASRSDLGVDVGGQ